MADLPQNSFQGPLAPKVPLNDSYRSPLHENTNTSSNPGGGGGRNFGKILPYGAIAVALLVIPLTINQLGQQQDVRQRASEPTPTIELPTPFVTESVTPPIGTESASISVTPSTASGELE